MGAVPLLVDLLGAGHHAGANAPRAGGGDQRRVLLINGPYLVLQQPPVLQIRRKRSASTWIVCTRGVLRVVVVTGGVSLLAFPGPGMATVMLVSLALLAVMTLGHAEMVAGRGIVTRVDRELSFRPETSEAADCRTPAPQPHCAWMGAASAPPPAPMCDCYG